MIGNRSDPQTKQELLDRLLREDFNGDLRSLAKDGALKIKRLKPHILKIRFEKSKKEYLLEIHKERPARIRRKIKASLAKRKKLLAKGAPAKATPKPISLRDYPTIN